MNNEKIYILVDGNQGSTKTHLPVKWLMVTEAEA